jgi:hypothetical protein
MHLSERFTFCAQADLRSLILPSPNMRSAQDCSGLPMTLSASSFSPFIPVTHFCSLVQIGDICDLVAARPDIIAVQDVFRPEDESALTKLVERLSGKVAVISSQSAPGSHRLTVSFFSTQTNIFQEQRMPRPSTRTGPY